MTQNANDLISRKSAEALDIVVGRACMSDEGPSKMGAVITEVELKRPLSVRGFGATSAILRSSEGWTFILQKSFIVTNRVPFPLEEDILIPRENVSHMRRKPFAAKAEVSPEPPAKTPNREPGASESVTSQAEPVSAKRASGGRRDKR